MGILPEILEVNILNAIYRFECSYSLSFGEGWGEVDICAHTIALKKGASYTRTFLLIADCKVQGRVILTKEESFFLGIFWLSS